MTLVAYGLRRAPTVVGASRLRVNVGCTVTGSDVSLWGKKMKSNLIWTTQLTAKLTPLKSFPSENEQMFLFT